VSVLQEVEPRHEDLERLYIAAHTLSGTSASYGFPRFSEIAGKLAHDFQYSLNAPLGSDLHGPLTEFLSDGISLLENDLLEINDTAKENLEDIAAFKERYRFAFPHGASAAELFSAGRRADAWPPKRKRSPLQRLRQAHTLMRCLLTTRCRKRFFEFFQPEAEEHLQIGEWTA